MSSSRRHRWSRRPEPEYSSDPRISQRQKEFDTLCKIQGKLERRWKIPVLEPIQLDEVLVECGAPFDIDSEEPLDFEPRYFAPGSVEEMERGIKLADWEWSLLEPIQYHPKREREQRESQRVSRDAFDDIVDRWSYCEKAVRDVTPWTLHRYVLERNMPHDWAWWQSETIELATITCGHDPKIPVLITSNIIPTSPTH